MNTVNQGSSFFILFIISCTLFFSCANNELKFDKTKWLNEPEERYKYVNELIESKVLIGNTKEDVKTLLGEDCKYCTMESDNWMYYLGTEKKVGNFKYGVLDVEFSDNKVVKASVR